MCFVNGVFCVCGLCFFMLLHMGQCPELLSNCVYMCCVCVFGVWWLMYGVCSVLNLDGWCWSSVYGYWGSVCNISAARV